MIAGVLADLRSRASHADLVRARDETTSATIGSDGGTMVSVDQSDTVHVRVVADGRLGWAGGATHAVQAVADSAVRSAAAGDAAEMFFPAPSALPAVITRSPVAAALSVPDLLGLARSLADRLRRLNLGIETWVERSVGAVDVGNSRGVLASYDVTLIGLGVSVAGGPAPCRLHLAAAGPPDEAGLDWLGEQVEQRFSPPLLEFAELPPTARVWFRPRAVRALLAPLLVRQAGDRWLATRGRRRTVDARLSLWDDPLIDGRPGSRPICDDGVPSHRRALIRHGQPVAGLLDLQTASRHGLPATSHGRRRGYRAPGAAFSNLILESADPGVSDPAVVVGDGLMVTDFEVGPAPNPDRGVFRVAAPWCYRIEGGRVVGRVEGAVLAGDVFQLLERVTSIGADAEWHGAVRVPSLVLDGVGVMFR